MSFHCGPLSQILRIKALWFSHSFIHIRLISPVAPPIPQDSVSVKLSREMRQLQAKVLKISARRYIFIPQKTCDRPIDYLNFCARWPLCTIACVLKSRYTRISTAAAVE